MTGKMPSGPSSPEPVLGRVSDQQPCRSARSPSQSGVQEGRLRGGSSLWAPSCMSAERLLSAPGLDFLPEGQQLKPLSLLSPLPSPHSPAPAATLEPSWGCSLTRHPFPLQNLGSCHFLSGMFFCQSFAGPGSSDDSGPHTSTAFSEGRRTRPHCHSLVLPCLTSLHHFHSVKSSYLLSYFFFYLSAPQVLKPVRLHPVGPDQSWFSIYSRSTAAAR